jgi:hypothetical protein
MITDATIEVNYWSGCQDALGFETVWSIWEAQSVDAKIFTDKPRKVNYSFISRDATMEELMNGTAKWITVSAVAEGGGVRDLWRAAESCYQQAKALGDWHYFIEDFKMNDDGSLKLCTGS